MQIVFQSLVIPRDNGKFINVPANEQVILITDGPDFLSFCSRRTFCRIRHCFQTMHFPNTVSALVEARLHARETIGKRSEFDERNLSNTKSISRLTRWKKYKHEVSWRIFEYRLPALFRRALSSMIRYLCEVSQYFRECIYKFYRNLRKHFI